MNPCKSFGLSYNEAKKPTEANPAAKFVDLKFGWTNGVMVEVDHRGLNQWLTIWRLAL